MKRLLLLSAFAVLALPLAFAQKGDVAIGTNINVGSALSSMGVGFKAQYFLLDNLRIEPSVDYSYDVTSNSTDITMWSVNTNVQYLFNITDGLSIYPYLGAMYSSWEDEKSNAYYDASSFLSSSSSSVRRNEIVNRFSALAGVGAEYYFTDLVGIYADLEYQFIKDYQQVLFSVGVSYKF